MIDKELEKFKTQINLVDFAIFAGYTIDKEKSSSISKQLRDLSSGDKIVVSQNQNGHYTYFSMTNDADNGTIVDFIQKRTRENLGQVRQKLRAFMKQKLDFTKFDTKIVKSSEQSRNFDYLWNKIQTGNKFQEWDTYRGIKPEILNVAIQANRMVIKNSEIYFKLVDTKGICGIEKRGEVGKALLKDSKKGLWVLGDLKTAERVLYFESPIDALSHRQIHGKDGDFIVSTGGSLSQDQKIMVREITRRMKKGAEVYLCTDNDKGGDQIAKDIKESVKEADRTIQTYLWRAENGKDWNEELQNSTQKMRRKDYVL